MSRSEKLFQSDAPGWTAVAVDWSALVEYYPEGVPSRELERLVARHGGIEVEVPCGPRHLAVVTADEIALFRRTGPDPILTISAEEVNG